MVLVLVFTAGAGTAGAQGASADGYLGVNEALAECAVTTNLVEHPEDEYAWAWVQAFYSWISFWNGPEPETGELFFTLQCAFSPAARAALATTPEYVQNLSIGWMPPEGAPASYLNFWACKEQNHGGDDWFPVLNGEQVRIGCTGTPAGSLSSFRSNTGDFVCNVGVQIGVGGGKYIRTYVHHSSINLTNSSGSFRAPAGYSVTGSPRPPCNASGFYTGGVVPPDWPAGDTPEWADVTGCNGLTVFSDDISDQFIEPGDEIPMSVGPIDPKRPPGGVDVLINNVEARPRGEPVRWTGSARWPGSPNFTFVVGEDVEQADWVFRLTCSDGTTKTVYYDPTGAGGNRRSDSVDLSFDLDECVAAAPDLELDPSSWVPGLVARLKCLVQWATSTSRPMEYRIGQLTSASEGTGFGDVAQVATAPYRTLGALSNGASEQSTITTGMGVITLPAVDGLTASRIRLALSVLLGLAAVRSSIRMWSRAANTRVHDE